MDRNKIVAHLNDLLKIDDFKDYAPNGLQIEGAENIDTICTAVTASQEVIDSAIQYGAQALLVHHGYFWSGEAPVITGIKRQRIASLLANNMNLLAYHLPLDCHPDLGNNKGLGDALGIRNMQAFQGGKVASLLWSGNFETPLSMEELAEKLSGILKRTPQVIKAHQKPIGKIAWCTGAAQDLLAQAKELEADAYISGEISERTFYQAMESNIIYFAAGHHATERFGVQQLGEYLQNTFKIQHHFIDAPNPI